MDEIIEFSFIFEKLIYLGKLSWPVDIEFFSVYPITILTCICLHKWSGMRKNWEKDEDEKKKFFHIYLKSREKSLRTASGKKCMGGPTKIEKEPLISFLSTYSPSFLEDGTYLEPREIRRNFHPEIFTSHLGSATARKNTFVLFSTCPLRWRVFIAI